MSGGRKKRIFEVIQIGLDEDWQSRTFDVLLLCMIVVNLAIACYSTFEDAAPYMGILGKVELVTEICFALEYGLRVWTAEYLYPKLTPGRAVETVFCRLLFRRDRPSFLFALFSSGGVSHGDGGLSDVPGGAHFPSVPRQCLL